MSDATIAALLALALGVVLVRRRSQATWLVAAQSLLLGAVALADADGSSGLLLAGGILIVRACALPGLLLLARRRTPEARPLRAPSAALPRLLGAVAIVVAALAVTPRLGLAEPGAEGGALALVCLGLGIAAMRRQALAQVLGILVAENGVYLMALAVPGGTPFVIELGVLFDLTLVVTVATAFAHRIHGELGSGDTDLLRGLRD